MGIAYNENMKKNFLYFCILLFLYSCQSFKKGREDKFLSSSPMKEYWSRINNWIQKEAPALAENINGPASAQEIKELENYLGVEFPTSFKDFYLIHNAQTAHSDGLMNAEEFLSLERIKDEWTVWNDLLKGGDFDGITSTPVNGIKNDWWNAKWIPITYDGGGNHICLDLDPEKGGKYGQMIRMWHDDDSRELIAPSFEAWIKTYVEDLEKGEYVHSDEYGGLIRKDEI